MNLNLTLSIFRVIRKALESGPWGRQTEFYDEAPKHVQFSSTFDSVTGYVRIEGDVYKITIVREMRQ